MPEFVYLFALLYVYVTLALQYPPDDIFFSFYNSVLSLAFLAGVGDLFVPHYPWELSVSLSKIDSDLCMYYLSAGSNSNLLHNS